MKDNLPFFSHDNNARRHPKMKALIAEFGYEGYGRFWALNERIAEASGACIDISRKVNKLDLANELGLDGNELDRFLTFLSDPEIDLVNIQDNKITTDRITELYTKTTENREYEREKKQQQKGKTEIPEGKEGFPEGKDSFPDGFPGEKDTDNTIQDNTKTIQDKTIQNNTNSGASAPPDSEISDPQKLFLYYWQHAPDIFNALSRIESPKEWDHFWKNSHVTREQVKTAMDNFIADARCGAIERRFIPSMPDRFALKGWITKCQKRFLPNKTAPPSGVSQSSKPKKSLL